MNKTQKAKDIVDKEQLFKRSETERYEYWMVKGSDRVYEVIYDNLKDYYTCGCNNIKLVDCYHVLAVKIMKKNKAI